MRGDNNTSLASVHHPLPPPLSHLMNGLNKYQQTCDPIKTRVFIYAPGHEMQIRDSVINMIERKTKKEKDNHQDIQDYRSSS